MKLSLTVKIKLGVSIILCILFLALIGRKQRENFQNNSLNIPNTHLLANRNPKGVVESNMKTLGSDIGESESVFASLKPPPKRECSLTINENLEKSREILKEKLNKEKLNKDKTINNQINTDDKLPDPNTCYLKFPAIL